MRLEGPPMAARQREADFSRVLWRPMMGERRDRPGDATGEGM
jgi:hypothetical protein